VSAPTSIFGVELHDVRIDADLRARLCGFLDGDRAAQIFTPNPEILLRARRDPGYAEILNGADLALPDGTGVAIILSMRVRRPVRRWPGVELAGALLRIAAERGDRVAFLGSAPGVAEAAIARWRAVAPSLDAHAVAPGVVIGHDGLGITGEDEAAAIEAVRAAEPAVVLVGLGAPKQERWIAAHADMFPSVRILIGVGGAFDMWAGRFRRAPRVLHALGLEWAWRLALEPSRLPRIVNAVVVFPLRVLADRRS
jgi:N-acetylglucosaminyldiphosphoundecaprenol N-acetyl-beta-D-mannosaminyltransferase